MTQPQCCLEGAQPQMNLARCGVSDFVLVLFLSSGYYDPEPGPFLQDNQVSPLTVGLRRRSALAPRSLMPGSVAQPRPCGSAA